MNVVKIHEAGLYLLLDMKLFTYSAAMSIDFFSPFIIQNFKCYKLRYWDSNYGFGYKLRRSYGPV